MQFSSLQAQEIALTIIHANSERWLWLVLCVCVCVWSVCVWVCLCTHISAPHTQLRNKCLAHWGHSCGCVCVFCRPKCIFFITPPEKGGVRGGGWGTHLYTQPKGFEKHLQHHLRQLRKSCHLKQNLRHSSGSLKHTQMNRYAYVVWARLSLYVLLTFLPHFPPFLFAYANVEWVIDGDGDGVEAVTALKAFLTWKRETNKERDT